MREIFRSPGLVVTALERGKGKEELFRVTASRWGQPQEIDLTAAEWAMIFQAMLLESFMGGSRPAGT